jgi:hypothetical protein
MRKLLCGLACVAPLSVAAGSFVAPGSSITFGSIEMPESIYSGTAFNPAAGELSLAEEEKIRLGAFSSFGLSFEFGQIDNFADDVDRLSNSLSDEDLNLSDATSLITEFDEILETMGEEGYLKIAVGSAIPIFPILIRSTTLGGTIAIDGSFSTANTLKILDAPLRFNPIARGIDSNISAYVKSAAGAHLSFGYSRPLFETKFGELIGGAKVNYDYLSLNKTVIPLAETNDITQTLQDELFNFEDSEGQASVDLGLMLIAKYLRVGAQFRNLNEPEFAYNPLGTDCLNKEGDSATCFAAQSFRGEIDLEETHIMGTQVTLSAASTFGGLTVAGSMDINETNTVLGEEERYVRAVASYSPTSFARYVLTNIRVGGERNTVGSQMTTINFGSTLFGWVNLDAAVGLDFIEVGGNSIPRKYSFSLGVSENF